MPFNVAGVSNSVSCTLARHSDTSDDCTCINHLHLLVTRSACLAQLVNLFLHVLCQLSPVTAVQRELLPFDTYSNYVPHAVTLRQFELGPQCVFIRYV